MNSISRLVRSLAAVPVALAVAIGVSHGGGGVTGTGGAAFGEIMDFGSIFVNGIEYFTTGAAIYVDDQPATESQLRVGMVVSVEGTLDSGGTTGNATRVDYRPVMRGSLDGAAAATTGGSRLVIAGLPVDIGPGTVLDGATGVLDFSAGDRVEVSGFRSSGAVLATRVTRSAGLAGTVLTGKISSVTGARFNLGDLAIDATGAAIVNATTPLAGGMTVRVKSAALPSGGTLAVSEVRVESGDVSSSVASLDGVVASLSTTTFQLGDTVVKYDNRTKWRNGTLADLKNGVRVQVDGGSGGTGTYVASRITFPLPDDGSVDATVVSKTATGFLLVSADGVEVRVNKETRWRDNIKTKAGTVSSLATLSVGDFVTVKGGEVADGVILATDVVRVKPDSTVLDGRARAVAAPAVSLLSMRGVDPGNAKYYEMDGAQIPADAFFSKAAGRRIRVVGDVVDGQISAERFEIKP